MNYTVVFDGDCSVCRRFAGGLLRWDREEALEIVPSQRVGVKDRFPWIPQEAFEASVQLISPEGTTWSGAAAMEKLLAVLLRGRWLLWVFRIPFMRRIAERGYRSFAGHRHRMGCKAD